MPYMRFWPLPQESPVVESDAREIPCTAINVLLSIFACAWFLHLNSNLQDMLSGIPMLCGRTVARKQS